MGVSVSARWSGVGEIAGGRIRHEGGGAPGASEQVSRLGPGGRAATITLAEWVEEYLEIHTGERVTIAKLRWLGIAHIGGPTAPIAVTAGAG